MLTCDMRGRILVFESDTLRLLCSHTPVSIIGSPHGMVIWRDEVIMADHDHHRLLAIKLKQPPPAFGTQCNLQLFVTG